MPGIRKVKVGANNRFEVEGVNIANLAPILPIKQSAELPEASGVFLSGHGWTNTGSGGSSSSDDTSDFIFGDRSRKLDNGTALDTAQSATRKSSLTLNMTGKYFVLYLKTLRISDIVQMKLQVSSDGFTNFRQWSIDNDKTIFKDNNNWVRVSLPWGMGTNSGTGVTRTSITEVQFKFTSNTESNAVWLGAVHSVPEPASAVCSLTFDDGYDSVWNKARLKMNEYGFRGTAFIIPDAVGTSGRATLQQLKDLQNLHGWDISGHDNDNLSLLDIETADKKLREVKDYLLKNGFVQGVDLYAYPNGAFNQEIINRAKKYYSACRSIVEHSGQETANPPADPHRLRIINITELDSTATVAARVTDALNNKEWIIMVFHNIVDTVTDSSTQISTANFNTIVTDVNTQGIIVKPVSQVLRDGT